MTTMMMTKIMMQVSEDSMSEMETDNMEDEKEEFMSWRLAAGPFKRGLSIIDVFPSPCRPLFFGLSNPMVVLR